MSVSLCHVILASTFAILVMIFALFVLKLDSAIAEVCQSMEAMASNLDDIKEMASSEAKRRRYH